MNAEPVLADTGPLVAILEANDQYHVGCVDQARQFGGPVYSCWPVITEAAWLLRDVPTGLERLLSLVAVGDLICFDLDVAAAEWINKYRQSYGDLRPQLADLCLVYLAQRERIRQIFTLDRRDFLKLSRTSKHRFCSRSVSVERHSFHSCLRLIP